MEQETTNKLDEVNNNVEGKGGEGKSGVEEETSITVTEAEEWLCVAKLPLDITEKEFTSLLKEFGKIDQSFLVRSQTTGAVKGYGLARFCSLVSGVQARHVLEGQELRGHSLDCGWLQVGTHPLSSLHSKVLHVDKLPKGYKDMGQFRNLFSRIVKPPYCQIAMKYGVIQDWGLVEFTKASEAEATLEALNKYELAGHKMRVQYCIPGLHAINIYMSFINDPMDSRSEKKALMEDTPNQDVYQQLEALSKQNPWFVQSLQSIMTQTILTEDTTSLLSSPQASLEAVAGMTGTGPLMAPSNGHQTKAQALVLLLAQELQNQQGQGHTPTSLLKQLEGGTSVAELLKSVLVPQPPQQHLVPPPPQHHLVPPPTHHQLVPPPSQQHLVPPHTHLYPPPGPPPIVSQVESNAFPAKRTTLLATPPTPQTPPTLLSSLPVTPPISPTPLLPSPPSNNPPNQAQDLSSLISTMTNLVGAGAIPAKPPPKVTPNTKNPQLMNMLYSAFQARMSKAQQQQQAQNDCEKASDDHYQNKTSLLGDVPGTKINYPKPPYKINPSYPLNNNKVPKPVPPPNTPQYLLTSVNPQKSPVTSNANISPQQYPGTNIPSQQFSAPTVPPQHYSVTSIPSQPYPLTSVPSQPYPVTSLAAQLYPVTSINTHQSLVTSLSSQQYPVTSVHSHQYSMTNLPPQQYPVTNLNTQKYPATSLPSQPYPSMHPQTAPEFSLPPHASSQTQSGTKNLSQFLSMPPPPPPPLYTSPAVGPNWAIPPPQPILFSPVISSVPSLWPPQPLIIPPPDSCVPPLTPPPPGLTSPPNMKRKLNGFYGQVAAYPDIENPTFKRQKLIGGN